MMPPFVMALVSPGVHDQENEHEKPKNQQQYYSRLVFPERPETGGEFVKVHAPGATYTTAPENKS